MRDKYFAIVVKVIDDFTVVINKGATNGITKESRFLIIEVGDEIIDPETGNSLGLLEITKGWCLPTHIQENICTIQSNEYKQSESSTEITKTRSTFIGLTGPVTEVSKPGRRYKLKLKGPNIGDKITARGIKPIEY